MRRLVPYIVLGSHWQCGNALTPPRHDAPSTKNDAKRTAVGRKLQHFECTSNASANANVRARGPIWASSAPHICLRDVRWGLAWRYVTTVDLVLLVASIKNISRSAAISLTAGLCGEVPAAADGALE
jgi:hypothetical protein